MALDKAWQWGITERGESENVTQNNYLLYIPQSIMFFYTLRYRITIHE